MNEHGLGKYCKTNHKVIGARWNESKSHWEVQVEDLTRGQVSEVECDILINASGILNHWRWPAIPGLDTYKGKLLHSASWDESLDLSGKNVGLIGNG